MSTGHKSRGNRLESTDRLSSGAGSCALNKEYHYRQCQTEISQSVKCPNWPESCNNIMCRCQHPMVPSNVPEHPTQEKGSVVFLWNIEKVPVPKEENVLDVVQRLRQKFVTDHDLREVEFSCCCNTKTLSEEDKKNLDSATVRMIPVTTPIPGAIDRKIIFELDRFERLYCPPTTVVLISDNITYLNRIDDLRHNKGFRVIVIQNKSTNIEFKAIADEHYSLASFTKLPSQVLPKPILRNNPRESTNPFTEFSPVLPDHKNDARNIVTPASTHPKQQASQHRSGSVIRARCPSNHTRPLQKITLPVLIPPASSSTREDDSSPHVPPTVVRQSRTREVNNKHRSNGEKLRRSECHENIPSAVSKYSLSCPFCTNEFNTVEELRQHQTDSNHLFDCPICKNLFSDKTDLRQHQKATKHVLSSKATEKKNIQ